MLGRSDVPSCERELEMAQQRLADERAGVETARSDLAKATLQRKALIKDAAAYAANEDEIRRLDSEVGRRTQLVDRYEKDIGQFERELERAIYAAARVKLEPLFKRAGKASAAFAVWLAEGPALLAALVDARAMVDEQCALVRELQPEGVDFELPANADEPEWGDLDLDIDTLAKLVAAGPLRPLVGEKQWEAELAAEERKRAALAAAVEPAALKILNSPRAQWQSLLRVARPAVQQRFRELRANRLEAEVREILARPKAERRAAIAEYRAALDPRDENGFRRAFERVTGRPASMYESVA